MRAADIGALRSVSRPTMHPDGTRVVVSVTRPDLEADATVGQLFNVPLDGSGSRRVTRGFRDTSPQFSPDGLALAFLRSLPGSPPQLYIVAAGGGEPIQLTDQKLGVSDIRWSPDSKYVAYCARVAEKGRYGSVDGLAASAEPARRITGVRYKANGLGYTNDRRSHVFSVVRPPLHSEPLYPHAPGVTGAVDPVALVPSSTQLTDGDFDHSAPRFIGDKVAFISARHDTRGGDLLAQLWLLDGVGTAQPLVAPVLSIEDFEVSAAGEVYFIAQDMGESGVDFVARNGAVYRLVAGQAERLTDPETMDATGTQLSLVGERVFVGNRARGRVQLVEVLGVDDVRTLTSGDIEVEGQAASANHLTVCYASPQTSGDVALVSGSELTSLTDFSAALRATAILTPTEQSITGRDGYPIHGWVLTPPGEGPHPTLLMIHGGPYSSYSVRVLDEAQVCADAGYAVVYCNPRGSASYGQAHGRSIQGSMGLLDHNDVLDFLDGALARNPALDSERLGILGGSYGGYLTAWTIAHDNRFGAAIVERGYLDPSAFVGSSDIGWFFPQGYNGYSVELLAAQSPQGVAHQVSTPTLVIHSEDDLRCPLSQAETYYASLKLGGVDAEMLIFPGEDHELSRSGRPRHRVERFDAILEWFERHL